jgi:hypothetical protein
LAKATMMTALLQVNNAPTTSMTMAMALPIVTILIVPRLVQVMMMTVWVRL